MIEKIYGANVLVEPKNVEEQTQSGIILTGHNKSLKLL